MVAGNDRAQGGLRVREVPLNMALDNIEFGAIVVDADSGVGKELFAHAIHHILTNITHLMYNSLNIK